MSEATVLVFVTLFFVSLGLSLKMSFLLSSTKSEFNGLSVSDVSSIVKVPCDRDHILDQMTQVPFC